ncbi:type II toxin-antitoxin system VapC family toxin [Microlunatus elymi]|uniref:type II toxin-antitoxin system VapC family toxin n=1 Tax=Microlunatus elymi TaxID=2596828 RepID=UPI001AEF6300|nr:type II toxin-antitoxin system VapC family toxin [Microlunatus elymi]
MLHTEQDSDALENWLPLDVDWLSSELAWTEVLRATRRIDEDWLPEAMNLLRMLDLIPVTRPVLERAALIAAPVLRSPDAIHLATAELVRHGLTAFVSYDDRLDSAARAAGHPTFRPRDPSG